MTNGIFKQTHQFKHLLLERNPQALLHIYNDASIFFPLRCIFMIAILRLFDGKMKTAALGTATMINSGKIA